jgi:cysteate synthase
MYGIENDEVYAAIDMFERTEGIDIVPAAGVAVASLKRAAIGKHIDKKDTLLLNVTGGGENRLRKDMKTHRVKPEFVSKEISEKEIEELLCKLLKTG